MIVPVLVSCGNLPTTSQSPVQQETASPPHNSGVLSYIGDQQLTEVAAGSEILVIDGKLTVTGNVGDGAVLTAKSSDGVCSSGIIIINGNVIGDGKDCSIIINGMVGDNVTIWAGNGIHIQDAGLRLQATAGNSFNGVNVGDWAVIEAGNSVDITAVLGQSSRVRGSNSVDIGSAGINTSVNAGNSVDLICAFSGVSVHAGNSVDIGYADESVNPNAGNDVDVDSRNIAGCPL